MFRSGANDPGMMQSFSSRQATVAVFAALAAVAILVYSPALRAPWYLDDSGAILQNPHVRAWHFNLRDIFFDRGLAYLSFALNYRFGGTDPFGYHLVNLALHIACGWLVFLLLRPATRGNQTLAAFGALLFIAHPLQTQAVTYIVQRMTLLSALFFLLALWLFARARAALTNGAAFSSPRHLGWYLATLLAGLCALTGKENAAVLPGALYLYSVFFLPTAGDRKRLLLSLLPFAIAPLLFVVMRLALPLIDGKALVEITRTTDLARSQQLSPLRYLVTEFSVLWVYIRLLFLPYGQALDHAYPVAKSFLEIGHLLAGAGLALLGALAFRVRRSRPLIAAGIGWFFLTLLVESSFIPLDPLFEHRLYLPMFGFVLVVLGLLERLPGERLAVAALAVAIVLCLPLTWQRNRLWADPVAFFSDNVATAPLSERARVELADLYLNAGRLAEAEPLLHRVLELNPESLPAYTTLAAVYNDWGRLPDAIAVANEGLRRYPRADRLISYLGAIYFNSGDYPRALETFDRQLAVHPQYARARDYRARTLARLGRWAEAEGAFRQLLASEENNLTARNELALVLVQQGKAHQAEAEWQRLLELAPGNADALLNLGLLAMNQGNRPRAEEQLRQLERVDPARARELQHLLSGGVR